MTDQTRPPWALVGVIVANLTPVNAGVIGLSIVGIAYLGLTAARNARTVS